MDFSEIKKLVGKLGSVAIFEQEGSCFVVLSYDKFKSLTENADEETRVKVNLNQANRSLFQNGLSDQDSLEKLNKDIEILKEEIKRKELSELESEEIESVID